LEPMLLRIFHLCGASDPAFISTFNLGKTYHGVPTNASFAVHFL
jgi:hypothetical protein